MEITQPNSNQLILRLRPILLWLVAGIFGLAGIWLLFHTLFGVIFVALSVFITASCGQVVTCVFDKADGRMTLKQQGLFGTQVTERRIRNISNIQVEESSSSDGITYRVNILLTTGESLPLTAYYSSGRREKQNAADRIRAFLNLNHSPQTRHGGHQPSTPGNRATASYPPDLPGVTKSQTTHSLFLSLSSNASRDTVQRLVRELPLHKMLGFTDPMHRGPLNEPDHFFLARRDSDYLMMSHGERWSSHWTPIEETVLVQYFMELSQSGLYRITVSDYTDFSDGARRVDRDPNADPACFIRKRVSEALKSGLNVANPNEMTPELWQTLGALAQKSVILLTDNPQPMPNGIDDLKRMGYVKTRPWGAGDQGVEYFISTKGRLALAAYRADQETE